MPKIQVTYYPIGFGVVWTKTYATEMGAAQILMLASKDKEARAWVKHNKDAYTVELKYV